MDGGSKCCALGAAYLAVVTPKDRGCSVLEVLRGHYPFIFDDDDSIYADIVVHNDHLRWSRERIAARLKERGL